MPISQPVTRKCGGFSLVELMVAMTIGLLLLTGLSMIFVNSTQANRELRNTAQQIENGRYASDILTQDLHLAGFYGRLYTLPAAPTSADPCEISDLTVLKNALAWPVQGYRAADLATRADITASTCDNKGLLTNANLQPGSDVLVVRRAHTTNLNPPNPVCGSSITPVNSTPYDVYIQATGVASNVVIPTTSAAIATGLKDKCGYPAPAYKYMVHVYFVAPCSKGSASTTVNGISVGGVCQSGDDTIPTLKRLELVSAKAGNILCQSSDSSCSTVMSISPLVEGIEYFKMEYGVDNLPSAVSSVTGYKGDGNVDSYSATPADWSTVIATKVYLLARNPDATTGHADTKSYVLGTVTVTPTDYAGKTNFKRHTFTAATRLINVAGRREIP